MSLTSWLKGRTKGVEEFAEIIKSAAPSKDKFRTLSGKKPSEYEMLVPYRLTKHHNAGFVGTAFDYLASFVLLVYQKMKKLHTIW
ncbi:hypothetical protein CWR48_18240 [Oceanobacillus arenosus]|uniref:Uncharacterized protein n=1 Tax=Oceanobacillus arenosus TaxID=1229153 RepID=A0A3D8PJ61_9BACI|nr:hypothetical protein [Oceanobacillus arenosus]RDW16126.1 hypothetical protein CWR48_18240 [Oceanobacillus arenosus]